jgi:hypothetical protein
MDSPAQELTTLLARLAASGSWRTTPRRFRVEDQLVKVVRLETLADLKRGATSTKDQLVLRILEDTIRRKSGG